ncbi:hypothetical protein TNCV_3952021 [Trichonephila clavipes]|uniref:Uncharacterized protein n=1 Tax=Trichonephila clavipes TaxID=2585209 RepID=A0A8X6VEC9_TRICX|nr:hypothetical protein TNCV_3952021 [Trichonephila clavipes]
MTSVPGVVPSPFAGSEAARVRTDQKRSPIGGWTTVYYTNCSRSLPNRLEVGKALFDIFRDGEQESENEFLEVSITLMDNARRT